MHGRFIAVGLFASTLILAPACSKSGGDSGSSGGPPFAGLFQLSGAGTNGDMQINVDGDAGKVVTFGKDAAIGHPGVFDAGDVFLQGIVIVGPNDVKAKLAKLTFADTMRGSTTLHWPASVSYVDVDIERTDTFEWKAKDGSDLTLHGLSSDWSGAYDKAGACESTFFNATISKVDYGCRYPERSSDCSGLGGDESYFWPSADCPQLGYGSASSSASGSWSAGPACRERTATGETAPAEPPPEAAATRR
jgi:hypothetical protein